MVAQVLSYSTWNLHSSLQHTGTFSCGMWNLVSDQGSKPGPLHWELGVLATGPPGKSCSVFFLFFSFSVDDNCVLHYFTFWVKRNYFTCFSIVRFFSKPYIKLHLCKTGKDLDLKRKLLCSKFIGALLVLAVCLSPFTLPRL